MKRLDVIYNFAKKKQGFFADIYEREARNAKERGIELAKKRKARIKSTYKLYEDHPKATLAMNTVAPAAAWGLLGGLVSKGNKKVAAVTAALGAGLGYLDHQKKRAYLKVASGK